MIEDAELLRRYATDRSEAAFAELVRRRVDLIYAVARRQCGGDTHLAEEVTQRVFVDLARKARALAGRTVISGWLYRSAQFAASDAVRAERRRRAREQEDFLMKETTTRPSGGHSGEEAGMERLRPLLDAALGELSEADRDAVALRFFEERPWAEVAGALGLKEDAARKRVARALDSLQGLLARRGITSTAAALGGALGGQAALAAPGGLAASVTASAMAGSVAEMGALGWCMAAFMKITKLTVGAVAVVLAVAVGFGVREQLRAREANGAMATITAERDRLMALLLKSEERARQKSPETKAIVVAGSAVAKALTTEEIDAAAEAELDQLVAGNPELQQLYVRQQTMRSRSRYGAFYRLAGLTPAQIEKFELALAERAQAAIDFPPVAVAQGLKKSDPAVLKLSSEAEEAKARALREVLGDTAYSELQNYERTSALRGVARDLAGELYFTETPPSARQADQLTEIVGASRGEQGGQVDWKYILAEAKSRAVLSPEQLAVLAEKKEQIEVGARIHVLIKSWREKAKWIPEK